MLNINCSSLSGVGFLKYTREKTAFDDSDSHTRTHDAVLFTIGIPKDELLKDISIYYLKEMFLRRPGTLITMNLPLKTFQKRQMLFWQGISQGISCVNFMNKWEQLQLPDQSCHIGNLQVVGNINH